MVVTNQEWVRHGHQKCLLAWVLQKPMTGKEIVAAMRAHGSAVRKEEVRFLLRKFEQRKLIYCVTPDELSGRVYFLTEEGQKTVRAAFGSPITELPERFNWKKYSYVQRGQVRKLALIEVGTSFNRKSVPKTTTAVRKQLLAKHPIGLGAALRAMCELEQSKLIKCVGVTPKRECRLYVPTVSGRRMVALLTRPLIPMPQEVSRTVWRQGSLKGSASGWHEKKNQTQNESVGT